MTIVTIVLSCGATKIPSLTGAVRGRARVIPNKISFRHVMKRIEMEREKGILLGIARGMERRREGSNLMNVT